MHVLQVTGVMNCGGAEVMLMDILRNLPSDIHFDFLVQTAGTGQHTKGFFDKEILSRGCRIFYICPQWSGGGLRYLSEFKKLILNKIGIPDVIHAHICRKCGMVALAANCCGIKKIVVHNHGCSSYTLYDWGPQAIEWRIQRFLINRYATDFFACSEESAKILFAKKVIKNKNFHVINNALNFTSFQKITLEEINTLKQEYYIDDTTLALGYVANIVPDKNHRFLLDVLLTLLRRKINTRLFLIGRVVDTACFNELKNKIQERGLEQKVTLMGERNDIPVCLSTFDLFLAPSKQEGFGMVVTEAQAAGLPCIISPGYPHSVDLGLGLTHFMDNYDPEKWADKILQVRNQKITDKEKIYAAVVQSGFDAAENTKRIIELYKK